MAKDFHVACSRSVLTGLALAVTSLSVAGCGGKEEGPVTAASSKFQVADDNTSTSPAASSASPKVAEPAAEFSVGGAAPAAPATPSSPASPATNEPTTPETTAVPAAEVPTPPTMPPMAAPGGGAKGYQVPESKEALLAFLQQLQRKEPKGQTQQEILDDYRSLHSARIQAADKLLAMSQEKRDRLAATQTKLDAMRALGRLGDRQATKQLNGYCRTVMKDQDPEIANLGRLMLFGLSLDSLALGEMTDVKPLLSDLKKLVSDQPNSPGVFLVTAQAARLLQDLGHKAAAGEAYEAIGNAFKDNQDQELAAPARSMLDMAKAMVLEVKLDLDGKLTAMKAGQPNSAQAVLDVLKALLGIEPPGDYVLHVLSQVELLMEICGNFKEAGEAFSLMENSYRKSPNAELAKVAAARAENGRRRAALFGQTFVVDGVQLDGTPFAWSTYQGKVVLVIFWAAASPPCLEELPNLKRIYENHRDKGFEVVGVNLDQDPQMVLHWLDRQPLPWTNVVSADPKSRGFEHPLVVKCGIDAIPFIVLVDREGKVNALHVRGEQLEQRLAQLLGPPSTPAAPATPAKPAAPGTSG